MALNIKKVYIAVALMVTVNVILTSCSNSDGAVNGEHADNQPEPKPVSEIVTCIPWNDDEYTGYVIQDHQGNDLGSAILSVRRPVADVYSFCQYYAFENKASLLLAVNVNASNLKPLIGGVTVPQVEYAPVTIYSYEEEEGKLHLYHTTMEGMEAEEHTVIDVPQDAYDDHELLFLLRTIPFEVGYTVSFTNVLAASARMYPIKATVISEEELQVPAGIFNVYKIKADMLGSPLSLWYAKEKPHYLVKFDDGDKVILLRKYANQD